MDIDFVYTWVDGSDPDFIALKSRYSSEFEEANKPNRFQNNDELKHSLRSVAMFAPWVRHIHIVTNGQIPKWLDVSHPKIKMVTHEQIFRWPEHLPTFNAHAIEAHLSRIPGLAEHLVFFNDDFFLGAPVEPRTFFSDAGIMRLNATTRVLPHAPAMPDKEPLIYTASRNATGELIKRFGDDKTYLWSGHQVAPLTKTFLAEVEEVFSEALTRCSKNRFRSVDDIALCLVVWNNYAYFTGQGVYRDITYDSAYLKNHTEHNRKELNRILEARPALFCLHDNIDTTDAEVFEPLKEFFRSYFPLPSPFEKKVEPEQLLDNRVATL